MSNEELRDSVAGQLYANIIANSISDKKAYERFSYIYRTKVGESFEDAAARVAYDLAGCIVEERNKRNTQNNKING